MPVSAEAFMDESRLAWLDPLQASDNIKVGVERLKQGGLSEDHQAYTVSMVQRGLLCVQRFLNELP